MALEESFPAGTFHDKDDCQPETALNPLAGVHATPWTAVYFGQTRNWYVRVSPAGPPVATAVSVGVTPTVLEASAGVFGSSSDSMLTEPVVSAAVASGRANGVSAAAGACEDPVAGEANSGCLDAVCRGKRAGAVGDPADRLTGAATVCDANGTAGVGEVRVAVRPVEIVLARSPVVTGAGIVGAAGANAIAPDVAVGAVVPDGRGPALPVEGS